ncbi:MAG: response regulator [Lachnoclostridium sp.]|jgi:PAS domain S-box-containing protein|nr:response regulator [Lachnoclostridium sp.]
MSKEVIHTTGLLDELKRLAMVSKTGSFDIITDSQSLPEEEREAVSLLHEIIDNFQIVKEYELMKYKLTSNALGIAHWDMDIIYEDPVNPDNKFTWSKEFRNILGFSDETDFPNIFSSWSSRLHPDDKEWVLKAFLLHINDQTGETPFDIRYRIYTKNNECRYFRSFGETMRDNTGVPLRVAGAIMDVTERKQLEETITKQRTQSEEMAHWYKSILDATPLPISVTGPKMRWTFVNKAVENFLGMKREDMIGKLCSNWNANICNTEDCGIACVRRGIKQTFFTHRGSSYQVDVEVLRDLDGKEAGYIEVVQDITKVEMMARREADEENKAKSIFLATMSHEMRTPLNAIIGMTMIAKKANDTKRKNYALKKIEDASTHLLGVINDVLDMSKIEANKLELSLIRFTFRKMLQKIVTVINYRLEEKRQILSIHVDDKIPQKVICDDQRLAQVITNLLTNAVKFTPDEGEITLDVSLIEEEKDYYMLRFEVKDNGIGISSEQQERLFRVFGQAEKGISRRFGGTGLGLAISKRIVELMGGEIWVESEQGKGSRFIFTIKINREEAGYENRKSGEYKDVPSESYDIFKGKRVLLVEDIDINREIVMTLLGDTGLVIDCAKNGKQAYEMIKKNPDRYHLVFMDIQMPVMDGLEATKRIRELSIPQCKEIPIIAMTANVFREDIDKYLKIGMNDHIGKPIDIGDIIQKIRKYIR